MCADLQPTARADTENEFPVPTHELIAQKGGKASFWKTDVREEGDVEEVVRRTVEEFGRLDMYVCFSYF